MMSDTYHEQLTPHAERVTAYRDDFEKHDAAMLDGYRGAFIWGCRDSGTNLILLDDMPPADAPVGAGPFTHCNIRELDRTFMFGGANDLWAIGQAGRVTVVSKAKAERELDRAIERSANQ